MSLPYSIYESAPAGKVTVIAAWVHCCTIIERALRQGKYLKGLQPFEIATFWTSFSDSDMTFGSDVSIAKWRACLCTIFQSAGKISRIHWSMYDVPVKRSTARFSKIPNCARACWSPIDICRDMRPCMGTACLIAALNGCALTGSACELQFAGRKELWTRLGRRPDPINTPWFV